MYKYFTLLFLFSITLSCTETPEEGEQQEKRILASSNGSHAELLVLVKNNLFQGATGQSILKHFAIEQDGLPQPEPVFKLIKVEPNRANTLLKRNKTILLIEKSDSSSITVVRNVWSMPQIVATITAPTDEEISRLIEENASDLVDRFQDHDRMIMRRVLKRSAMRALPAELKELGVESMLLSKGFRLTLDKDNLLIYTNKGLRTDQYMVFYTENMREGIVNGEDIIRSRDSIGKNFIEGFRDSSYIATEMIIPPVQKVVDIGDMYAVETRGLWKTVGDFMGGPFLSYTIYDENNDQMLVVESMVYGPDSKKRNVLFELETMMRSIVTSKN